MVGWFATAWRATTRPAIVVISLAMSFPRRDYLAAVCRGRVRECEGWIGYLARRWRSLTQSLGAFGIEVICEAGRSWDGRRKQLEG